MIATSGNRTIQLTAVLLSGLVLLTYCRKDVSLLPPVIQVRVSPQSGNTTQTFTFDLTQSESRTGRGSKVFTRWDWDGNGTWDTPFTRLMVYEHRYYAAGTWKSRVEMTNLDGSADTMSFAIPVTAGFSPPKAALNILPLKGHIYTRFLLDASATHDDEDSLDQLTFRWDFEGDGQWDTSFGDSLRIFHIYPETGLFTPGVQVKDASGLIGSHKSQLLVNREDPLLVAAFRCIPDSVLNDTPIIMDASASSDPENPGTPMQYRWDWNNDQVWDTEWLSDPKTEHVFNTEYIHFVRLQIRSQRGLLKETVLKILVRHRNLAPRAAFSVSTLGGNVNTVFRFDCWSTRDAESSPSAMFYRWDFDGDGSWDTDYINSVITMHQYSSPGTYNTTLEVKDPHGDSGTFSKTIYISHGTNQTGIYNDTRGINYESYGTVLIGDQWWMTRNMSVHDSVRTYQHYYNIRYEFYYDYGNLYEQRYLPNVCPPGWRIPSREDWDKLLANYPDDQRYDALMPGGISDFSACLGGMGLYSKYQGIDRYGYYWSTTKPMSSGSVSIWIITFDKPAKQVLRGYYDETGKQYSVRCLKDN